MIHPNLISVNPGRSSLAEVADSRLCRELDFVRDQLLHQSGADSDSVLITAHRPAGRQNEVARKAGFGNLPGCALFKLSNAIGVLLAINGNVD